MNDKEHLLRPFGIDFSGVRAATSGNQMESIRDMTASGLNAEC